MNERGVTVLDSLLTLSILLMITLTISPYVNFLNKEIVYAKQMLHASEVAYVGVYHVGEWGRLNGTVQIDGVAYHWRYHTNEICVQFMSLKGEESYCVQADQPLE